MDGDATSAARATLVKLRQASIQLLDFAFERRDNPDRLSFRNGGIRCRQVLIRGDKAIGGTPLDYVLHSDLTRDFNCRCGFTLDCSLWGDFAFDVRLRDGVLLDMSRSILPSKDNAPRLGDASRINGAEKVPCVVAATGRLRSHAAADWVRNVRPGNRLLRNDRPGSRLFVSDNDSSVRLSAHRSHMEIPRTNGGSQRGDAGENQRRDKDCHEGNHVGLWC